MCINFLWCKAGARCVRLKPVVIHARLKRVALHARVKPVALRVRAHNKDTCTVNY